VTDHRLAVSVVSETSLKPIPAADLGEVSELADVLKLGTPILSYNRVLRVAAASQPLVVHHARSLPMITTRQPLRLAAARN
jgi:hypothetical protein